MDCRRHIYLVEEGQQPPDHCPPCRLEQWRGNLLRSSNSANWEHLAIFSKVVKVQRRNSTCWIVDTEEADGCPRVFTHFAAKPVLAADDAFARVRGAVPGYMTTWPRCGALNCIHPDHLKLVPRKWRFYRLQGRLDLYVPRVYKPLPDKGPLEPKAKAASWPSPGSADFGAEVRRAYAAGEGGYSKLADRYGVTPMSIRYHVKKAQP